MNLSNFASIQRFRCNRIAVFLCLIYSSLVSAQDLQSWSVKIDDGTKRFHKLFYFNNEAVLDKETQLVWERAPSQEKMKWKDALLHCQFPGMGARLGWRLPSIAEISSILDASVTGDENTPALPLGHPFLLDTSQVFWSVDQSGTEKAWSLTVTKGGIVDLLDVKKDKASVWCVRSS